MHWASWQEFWAMGGSGAYVWGAYGAALAALGLEVGLLRARMRRARLMVRRTADAQAERRA